MGIQKFGQALQLLAAGVSGYQQGSRQKAERDYQTQKRADDRNYLEQQREQQSQDRQYRLDQRPIQEEKQAIEIGNLRDKATRAEIKKEGASALLALRTGGTEEVGKFWNKRFKNGKTGQFTVNQDGSWRNDFQDDATGEYGTEEASREDMERMLLLASSDSDSFIDALSEMEKSTAKRRADGSEFDRREGVKQGGRVELQGLKPRNSGITTTLPDGTIVQVGGDRLPKPVERKETQTVISMGQSLARLASIKKEYDPSFLTYQGKARNLISRLKSKADIDLSPEDRKYLKQSRRFTQAVNYEFNAYRKLITGAAAAMSELEDLKKAVINTDLSPDEFEAAYAEYVTELTRSMRIGNKLIREGLQPGTKQFGEALDGLYLSGGDDDLEARGNALMRQGLSAKDIVKKLKLEGYK